MAWETRGNSSYYYRKRRIGKKVVSEYIGKGIFVEEVANSDLEEIQRKNEALEANKQAIREIETLSLKVAQIEYLTKRIVRGFLIASGFHNHKGEWRKKRNGR